MSIDSPVAAAALLPSITAPAQHGLAVAVLRLPQSVADGRLAARTTVVLLQAAPGHARSSMFRDQPCLRRAEQPVAVGAVHAIECATFDQSSTCDSRAQISLTLDQVSSRRVTLLNASAKYAELRCRQPQNNIINSRIHICPSAQGHTYATTQSRHESASARLPMDPAVIGIRVDVAAADHGDDVTAVETVAVFEDGRDAEGG